MHSCAQLVVGTCEENRVRRASYSGGSGIASSISTDRTSASGNSCRSQKKEKLESVARGEESIVRGQTATLHRRLSADMERDEDPNSKLLTDAAPATSSKCSVPEPLIGSERLHEVVDWEEMEGTRKLFPAETKICQSTSNFAAASALNFITKLETDDFPEIDGTF